MNCTHSSCIVADAVPTVAGSSWLTEGDKYMLDHLPEERDFYFSCGCWSGQADHTCGNGMGEWRRRYGCRCGAPDDCYCHEDCSGLEGCEAHVAEYRESIAEDHAEAILMDIARNLWT